MKRRSSVQITLVLIGMVTLAGCQREQRNVYKSKEDCLQDWGQAQECEQVNPNNNYYGGAYHPVGYFYGPRYTGDAGTRAGVPSTRAVTVARGGFGSSAHSGGG